MIASPFRVAAILKVTRRVELATQVLFCIKPGLQTDNRDCIETSVIASRRDS